jgi:hypothetical protein
MLCARDSASLEPTMQALWPGRSLQSEVKVDGDCLAQEFSATQSSGLCKTEFCSSQLRGWKVAGNARILGGRIR